MLHCGAKCFERLKLTNVRSRFDSHLPLATSSFHSQPRPSHSQVRNREDYPCEWRPCQQALGPLCGWLARWATRRVLTTSDEVLFAAVLRQRGLSTEALLRGPWNAKGLAGCCVDGGGGADAAVASVVHEPWLQPGGVILSLVSCRCTARAAEERRPSSPLGDEGGTTSQPEVVASVACVLAPGGGLAVWAGADEVAGLLDLLS